MKKVLKFLSSLLFHALNFFQLRSVSEIEKYYAVCWKCPYFIDHDGRGECDQCGCNLSPRKEQSNKIAWKTERCPINRWPTK